MQKPSPVYYAPKELFTEKEYKEFSELSQKRVHTLEEKLRFRALQNVLISRRKKRLEKHFGCGFDHD